MRSGKDFIEGLRDGRTIYLDGERVRDVTTHPAFAGPIQVTAELYDRAAGDGARADTTYVDPATGERYSSMWLIPRSREDIAARRRLHRFWAEPSYGLIGRSPDCGAGVLAGWAGTPELFGRAGAQFAENVTRFYEKMRAEDKYLVFAILPPQVDRSKPAHQQPEPFLYAGAVRERDDGIVVRGAQMIATNAVMADWIELTYISPLAPGDDDYAICVMVPCNAPNLRIYPRRPFATMATSRYDYPLSTRFDESDALLVFKDVFVPWEHVFAHRRVDIVNSLWHETAAHLLINFQTMVRFCVKLEFLAGLAATLTEVHGINVMPPVQGSLGRDFALRCATFQALAQAAENNPLMLGSVARPNPLYVYAGMNLQRRLMPEILRAMRELAGGAFQSVPSSDRQFTAPETAEDTKRYYQGSTVTAEQRVKILKLIWDIVGTEFAGRQLQYEMFYSAAQHVADARLYRWYDWQAVRAMVDRCLSEY